MLYSLTAANIQMRCPIIPEDQMKRTQTLKQAIGKFFQLQFPIYAHFSTFINEIDCRDQSRMLYLAIELFSLVSSDAKFVISRLEADGCYSSSQPSSPSSSSVSPCISTQISFLVDPINDSKVRSHRIFA